MILPTMILPIRGWQNDGGRMMASEMTSLIVVDGGNWRMRKQLA
jgi:hypothetical protein